MIDTASLKEASAFRGSAALTLMRDRARYLVAEYLHDWGLRDPDVIASESRRIVEQAEGLTITLAGDDFERELRLTAIEIAVDEVEAAIARMATPKPGELSGVPTNNSIVPRLGEVLLEFPDAIRHRDRPAARLLNVLERSVSPIIPCSNHREMRPQPRTRLLKLLRKGYWHRFKRRLNTLARRTREGSR